MRGLRRFGAVFKKEWRQILRDPLTLGMLIFVPAFLLILYGYALSFDVKHIRVAVLDFDKTPQSREFLDSLFQNPYFDRVLALDRVSETDALLARGKVRASLVIPRGYAASLARGEEIHLQMLIDAADANAGMTTIGYVDALADRMTRQVREDILAQAKMTLHLPSVVLEPRIWFNPDLESAHFLIPGLIALLMTLSAVLATSVSLVREKERETMQQIMVSPLRPYELILGKILPYGIVCILTMSMILLFGYVLFGVRIRGSVFLLGLSTLIFLFAALGLGVLISAFSRTQQMAFQAAIIVSVVPSIVLSGLIFPIKNMPMTIQLISCFVIPRYFIATLRAIILKAAPFSVIWPFLASMVALGILFNLLAALNTRKVV